MLNATTYMLMLTVGQFGMETPRLDSPVNPEPTLQAPASSSQNPAWAPPTNNPIPQIHTESPEPQRGPTSSFGSIYATDTAPAAANSPPISTPSPPISTPSPPISTPSPPISTPSPPISTPSQPYATPALDRIDSTPVPSSLGNVQQASNLAPLAPVDPSSVNTALTLLRQSLAGQCSRPLAGKAISLSDVLHRSAQRPVSAQAYWRLARAVAAHRFCVEETDFLLNLPVPHAADQQAVLTSLQAIAKADEARAKLDAMQAQYALTTSLPSFTDAELPLPKDLPYVGSYETHFAAFRQRGVVSEQLARIDSTLPVLRALVDQQASAVFATDDAVTELGHSYQAGQTTLSNMLKSFEHLQKQRRAFLTSVLEYNESIARYAFTVASPNLPINSIVRMLIESPNGEKSVLASRRTSSDIRRVSNEAEVTPSLGWSGRQ